MNRDKSKKIITVELPHSVWKELKDTAKANGMFFNRFMQLFIMRNLDEMKSNKEGK
jgi:predicted DNA binding CopG/RHH family protein